MTRYGLFILLVSLGPCWAMTRFFPANVQVGDMQAFNARELVVDKQHKVCAPNLRVYSAMNTLLLSNYVPQTAKVAFVLDPQGRVLKLWLLHPREISHLQKCQEMSPEKICLPQLYAR